MKSSLTIIALLTTVILQRLVELVIARRNERRARARGAREFGASHYPLFFLLHIGWILGTAFEGTMWPFFEPSFPVTMIFLLLFLGAQALRYAAIVALGERWNTRILVVEGEPYIRRGIYQYLAHPNYVAVCLELFVVPMAVGALYTALVATVVNAVILLTFRLPAERNALRLLQRNNPID